MLPGLLLAAATHSLHLGTGSTTVNHTVAGSGGVPWPLSLLTGAVSWLAGLIIQVFGYVLMSVLKGLMGGIVIPLLKATLFHPLTITGTSVLARAMGTVWVTMVLSSSGVAIVSLLWGVFRRMSGAAMSSRLAWSEVAEGLGMYALTLVGGWAFLAALLNAANGVTNALLNNSQQILLNSFANPTFGTQATALGAVVLTSIIYPLMAFALAGVLLWAVIQWIMRQVDLVFFGGLLPIAAALSLSGNKTAFTWVWQEAMGAIFAQLSMVVAWWIAWVFLSGGNPTQYSLFGSGSSFSVLHLALGIGAFAMIAKAPQMLSNITGHQHAGVAGLAMGVAAGSLMASTGRTLARSTPGGAAITEAMRNRQEVAKAKAAELGSQRTMGQNFLNSPRGQSLVARFSRGQQAVGRAVNSLPTPLSQGIQATAGRVKSTAQWASNSRVGRAVRTAGSLAYQPGRTLGAMQNNSMGQAIAAQRRIRDTQATTGTAVAGKDATVQQLGMKATEFALATQMSIDPRTNQAAFPPEVWQGRAYQKAQENAPAFLKSPTAPRAERVYR